MVILHYRHSGGQQQFPFIGYRTASFGMFGRKGVPCPICINPGHVEASIVQYFKQLIE